MKILENIAIKYLQKNLNSSSKFMLVERAPLDRELNEINKIVDSQAKHLEEMKLTLSNHKTAASNSFVLDKELINVPDIDLNLINKSELARRLNISKSYLSMLLSGERKSTKRISQINALLKDEFLNNKIQ